MKADRETGNRLKREESLQPGVECGEAFVSYHKSVEEIERLISGGMEWLPP